MNRVLPLLMLMWVGCVAPNKPIQAPTTLRIMSYNIKHGYGMDGRIDFERIAAVIRKQNPDVVTLQEVDKAVSRSGGVDTAQHLGQLLGMTHHFAKFMDYQGGEYGLAVLSKLPIVESHRHPLPDGAEPRCALEVVVNVGEKDHLVSVVAVHNDWTDVGYRIAQTEVLDAALSATSHPVILAGDFNGLADDASLSLLEERGWQIVDKGGAFTFPSVVPDRQIDFFMHRGFEEVAVENWVVDERIASDHRPIVGVFSYRK
jgi:endonuclease/exonuclease/phosphatase family metal-dependent hydrolase